jgi:hypothetical protein
MTESRGGEAVMRATPKRRNPAVSRLVDAEIDSWAPAGANKWTYEWTEVIIASGTAWSPKPNGKSSGDVNREPARNYAEFLNTAAQALYGVDLNQPLITITVGPIPVGQIILLREVKRVDDGRLFYFFEALNPTTVECNQGLAVTHPLTDITRLPRSRTRFGTGVFR